MKDYIILLLITLVIAIIISIISGLDLNNASAIADWLITGVLLVLVIPFIMLRIKDQFAKRKK